MWAGWPLQVGISGVEEGGEKENGMREKGMELSWPMTETLVKVQAGER